MATMVTEVTLQSALRGLSASPEPDGEFVIVEGDVRITIRSRADTKSATVRLTARYDAHARGAADAATGGSYREPPSLHAIRPIQIAFRKETDGNREGKLLAENVEVQTGDPAFDSGVYVDSPTTDGALLRGVLNAEVRAAVLDLLALRVDGVVLDDLFGDVQVDLTGHPTLINDDDRAPKLVRAFARLARSVPPVTATGERHASPPWFGRIAVATVAAVLGAPLMPVAFLYVAQMFGGTIGVGLRHLVLKEGYGAPRLVDLLGAFLSGP